MKLLGISGSLRADSYNTRLVRAAAEVFNPSSFTMADLRLPLYDGDLEAAEGAPEAVVALHGQICHADAIVISCPEYNAGLSGVMKNALDWVSRLKPMPFKDKPVAIMSAAAGRTGGARSQMTLRHCLVAFRPHILQGPELMVPTAHEAFDGGRLTNEIAVKALNDLMDELRQAAELRR
jgi:chromate reductase